MENIVKRANSDVSPQQVETEDKKLVELPELLSAELQDLKKMPCFRYRETLTGGEKNFYDHQTSCLNYVRSSNNPSKRYMTLESFQFKARSSLKDDFYKDCFRL